MIIKTACKHCGRGFRYQADLTKRLRRRQVCDACLRLPDQRYAEKHRAALKAAAVEYGWERSDAAQATQQKVARMLGVSENTVMDDERMALAKLRKHPELLELWAKVREEGVPVREDVGTRLLEYQEAVGLWWEKHEKLVHIDPEGAVELRRLIEQFQAKLGDYLRRKP